MDEEEVVTAEPVVRKPKGGWLKKSLIVLLVLASIGGGAWWWLGTSDGEVAAEAVGIEARGIVPFETFLVNLTDPGGNRFLKVTLELVFDSDATAKRVADSPALMGHLRSSILELLTEQNAPALVTAEGKQKLKDGVITKVAKVLPKTKVLDVLFSEFVVQF